MKEDRTMSKLFRRHVIILLVLSYLVGCTSEKIEESKVREETVKTEDQDTFFLAVEEMPKIIGGLQAIQQRIRYPELAIRAGIEGTVYVHAYVDMEGNVARTEILRDPGAGLGEAAADAVARTQFEPGKQQGEPVPVRVSIPVHFRLARPEVTKEEVTIRIIEGPYELRNFLSIPENIFKEEIEGTVHIEVRLNEDGRVIGIMLVEGFGHGLDQAVIQAVARYPFYCDENYNGLMEPTTFSIRVQFSF